MATGTKAYLQDKDGKNLLVGSDWSIIQNKPNNLATTDQLGKLSPWKRDGIQYENGAYDWDHVNNGYNCAYRAADFGSFKLVEVRLAFGVNKNITQEVECIKLPAAIRPDGNEEFLLPSSNRGVFIHTKPDMTVCVFCQQFGSNDQYSANSLLTFHHTYLTTL